MKKNILKNIIMIGIIISIALLLAPVSNAALAINPSKTTVSPGETFNVTVSVSSNEAGAITLSASNGTLSQTNIDLMTEQSATVSCVAGTSGTITIKGTGLVANYTTETEATQNASTSVKINVPTPTPTPTPTAPETTPTVTATPAPVVKSSNTKLANLGIEPNDFSGFTASKKEYYVTVPYEVEMVNVYAKKAESSQTISGTGNKTLEIGATTRCDVTVTAEDGNKDTYKIFITRKSEPTETIPNVVEEPEELLKLSTLEIKNAAISPEFNPDIYEYEVNLTDENIEKLDILATANIENASIEVTGNENFMEGENTVTIVLKSEDGTKAATYTIVVTKGAVAVTETPEPVDEQEQVQVEEEKKSIFSFLKSGNTGMTIILIIAIIVLLASIATVVVILIKNKKDATGEMMNFTPNSEYNVFEEKVEDKKEDIDSEEKPNKEKRRGKHF